MNNASLNPVPDVQLGLGKLLFSEMNNASLDAVPGVQRSFDKLTGMPVAWKVLRPFEVRLKLGGTNDKLQMKKPKHIQADRQPEPFTPGLTKGMVREHAQRLFDERLLDHDPLTHDDWVLAERDLVGALQKTVS